MENVVAVPAVPLPAPSRIPPKRKTNALALCADALCDSHISPHSSEASLAKLLKDNGLNITVFTCIAKKLTNLNSKAFTPTANSFDVGLFQEPIFSPCGAERLCAASTATECARDYLIVCGVCPWVSTGCIADNCCNGETCNPNCQLTPSPPYPSFPSTSAMGEDWSTTYEQT
jgi:hypothetical protein